MRDFLNSPLAKWILVLIVASAVVRFVWRRLFPPSAGPLHLRVRCSSCGWTGTVGKYMRKCGRCASTAVEDVRR